MTTMDETKLNAEMTVEPQVEEQNNASEKKTPWKEVTMGGAAGIVLGIASTACVDAIAKDTQVIEDPQNGDEPKADIPEIGENVNVASQVNDEMSFSEAFASARKEVGAGGVFVWRGQVYGTYYKTEWDAMSDEQKADYWAAVRGTDVIEEPEDETENGVESESSETEETDNAEVEPQLVASGETANGSYAEIYDTTGNGQGDLALVDVDNDGQAEVQIVDVDGDGQPDIMAADANGDGIVDEDEVYQITEDGVVGMNEVDCSPVDDCAEPTCII